MVFIDAADQVDELREEISALRGLIDVALDHGLRGDDPLLRSCASTLRDRLELLDELVRVERPA